MQPPTIRERYATFAQAIERARALAAHLGHQTIVQSTGGQWLVRTSLPPGAYVEADDDGESQTNVSTDCDEEYEREVRHPLIQEMYDYQEACVRSEEDGWFYED